MYAEVEAKEQTLRLLKGYHWVRTNHGSLFDRGSADSYYGRPRNPHYGGVGGHSGDRVVVVDKDSVAEYNAGYDYNEQFGHKKDYS
jgi:hypothetical protein